MTLEASERVTAASQYRLLPLKGTGSGGVNMQ